MAITVAKKLLEFVANQGHINSYIKWLTHTLYRTHYSRTLYNLNTVSKMTLLLFPILVWKGWSNKWDPYIRIDKAFRNSWAPLSRGTPISLYGHTVHFLEVVSLILLWVANWRPVCALRGFTHKIRLFAVTWRHGKTLQGTHVLYPVQSTNRIMSPSHKIS